MDNVHMKVFMVKSNVDKRFKWPLIKVFNSIHAALKYADKISRMRLKNPKRELYIGGVLGIHACFKDKQYEIVVEELEVH